MLKQQIIGILNLGFPIVILFQFFPGFVTSLPGSIIISLVIGFYVYYVNSVASKNMAKSLLYRPTGQHAQELNQLIQACGVAPETVNIYYAFTNDVTAMAVFNNIIIDPVVCSLIEQDPQATQVINIFENAIKPQLPPEQKERLQQIKQALSAGAQRFIFKHELGHVVRYYSTKKLIIIWIIGSTSVYLALLAAGAVLAWSGIAATCIGLFVGGNQRPSA